MRLNRTGDKDCEVDPVTTDQSKSTEPRRLRQALKFGPRSWLGAAYCLLIVGSLVFFGSFLQPVPSLFGWLATVVFAVTLWLLSLLLGSLLVEVLNQLQRGPERYRWLCLGTVFFLVVLLYSILSLVFNVILLLLFIFITTLILGAGIGAVLESPSSKLRRRLAAIAVFIGGTGIVAFTLWVIWPGPTYQQPLFEETSAAPLVLEDPSRTGPYPVLHLTYGSGSDQRRPEYGVDVGIRTPSADVSEMVQGWTGVTGWLRTTYWGFGPTQVPLNARVWYPDGEGPFPLVLMVHGNHSMYNPSDPGYEYLGRLLASRGYIAASVDQNFLNAAGGIEMVLGRLRQDNNARAYLLLRHLDLWHRWNQDEQSIFKGKVDAGNIGLIGHSRGGEAASIAAAFNHLPAHPGNANIRFEFGYDIQSVVAIAPSDGQYRPRRQPTPLENVSYLAVQGSADSDVRAFEGSSQYDRVSFTDGSPRFKAAVYVHGANHGQFNTRWGRVDVGAIRWFLNRADIMPVEQQEAVAAVFISSFLEATLGDHGDYEALFENPLVAGQWLPQTLYLTQYQSSRTMILADFEEDLDVETATIPGGAISGENLTVWREQSIALGNKVYRSSVSVFLAWDHGRAQDPSYGVKLPGGLALSPDDALTLSLANNTRGQEPIDLTVELSDAAGQTARLPLSHVAPLMPPFTYRALKPPLRVAFEWEPVFTTYTFALDDFRVENAGLDLSSIREIRLRFDLSPEGAVFLDDLGIRAGGHRDQP